MARWLGSDEEVVVDGRVRLVGILGVLLALGACGQSGAGDDPGAPTSTGEVGWSSPSHALAAPALGPNAQWSVRSTSWSIRQTSPGLE